MSQNIRFPNITETTQAGQFRQMQSYMFQLVEQLNWALSNLESGGSGSGTLLNGNSASAPVEQKNDSVASFNQIKALIIKSADIVNAYYDEINRRLEGMYVAESDFGIYAEQIAQEIAENSTAIEQMFSNMQQILTDIEGIGSMLIEVNAHIRSGLLYYNENGVPVYGLEIGQRNEVDGEEVFNKYARFVADKLSFYDQNDSEVAYISDYKLYITNVEVTGLFRIGGFVDTVLAGGSVVTKWVGGA